MGNEWHELKKARIEAGMTQQDLAYKAGMTLAQLSQYETGRADVYNMRIKTLLCLAKVLRKTLDELLGSRLQEVQIRDN